MKERGKEKIPDVYNSVMTRRVFSILGTQAKEKILSFT